MRRLLVPLFVAGLMVVPTFGQTVNVQLTASSTSVNVGTPVTVNVQAECTAASTGVMSIGGDITATGASLPAFTYGALAAANYPSTFQGLSGVLDGNGNPLNLPPAVPVAGANGAVTGIGSAQTLSGGTLAWNTGFASGSYVTLFSYTITPTSAGTVTLAWLDKGNPGYAGWYTSDTSGVAGVSSNTGVTITVTGATKLAVVPASCIPADLGGNATAYGSFWRTSKNVIRLQMNGNITALPAAGQIQVIQALASGATGTDVSSSWTYSIVNDANSNPTILQLIEPASPTPTTMVNKSWYAVRNNGWTAADNFVVCFPLMKGDVNGDGKVNSTDLSAQLGAATTLNAGPISRFDVNGDNKVNSTDLATILASPTSLAVSRPTGWTVTP